MAREPLFGRKMNQYDDDGSATRLEAPERLSRLVVETVADAENVPPTELDPLYSTIDPDLLDALFRPQLDPGNEPPTGEVRFPYHGYEVRVTAAGLVELEAE